MPRLLGGFVSPALRWWSPWWWPLVHLCSFRCRLLDGSHYTRLANVRQTKPTQTTPKPLQTLAFVGVSQPHDGDTKKRRGHHSQGDGLEPRPRRHDMTTTDTDGHTTTATHTTDMHGHARQPRPRPRSCTVTSHAIAHTKDRARLIAHDMQSVNRTNVPPLQHATNPRWGSLPPGQKAGAACSLVLTLNARRNIFGLPVTHEVFTYLVVATVVAPYILCIMFLGLMLMAVKLA